MAKDQDKNKKPKVGKHDALSYRQAVALTGVALTTLNRWKRAGYWTEPLTLAKIQAIQKQHGRTQNKVTLRAAAAELGLTAEGVRFLQQEGKLDKPLTRESLDRYKPERQIGAPEGESGT